jgi:hypothetical protein
VCFVRGDCYVITVTLTDIHLGLFDRGSLTLKEVGFNVTSVNPLSMCCLMSSFEPVSHIFIILLGWNKWSPITHVSTLTWS